MSDDLRPLFVVNQGALTNLASAYLMEPRIAGRLTAIWIGGGVYPNGSWEFNFLGDPNAANVVFDSNIELWQVPINVYSTIKVSFSELFEKVYPCGEIGRYLVENTIRIAERFGSFPEKIDEEVIKFNGGVIPTKAELATGFPGGEMWSLGDSPVVGLMLNASLGAFTIESAPRFNSDGTYQLRPDNERKIRVYNRIDSKFILNDMFAKLKHYFS